MFLTRSSQIISVWMFLESLINCQPIQAWTNTFKLLSLSPSRIVSISNPQQQQSSLLTSKSSILPYESSFSSSAPAAAILSPTRVNTQLHSTNESDDDTVATTNLSGGYVQKLQQQQPSTKQLPYASPILWQNLQEYNDFLNSLSETDDPLWEQVRLEAMDVLGPEPEAGPQIYQGILSQPSLLVALVTIVAHDIETELIKATELRNLFLDMLTPEDEDMLHQDVVAVATRSPSVGSALTAILFHMGLHAMVCYRVGHRLWQADRSGLAYYLQSTVSRRYSADIHPACRMGSGTYLSSTAGVVIGETAITGNDVSVLHGVTLGGTGKERGDRHPKVGHGVILQDGATVLGNIKVGDGAVITAKSIVTKPVPPLAIMRGVPAKVDSYRCLEPECFSDDLEMHLAFKYLDEWKKYLPDENSSSNI